MMIWSAAAFAQADQDGPPPHNGPFVLNLGAGGLVAPYYPGATKYQALPLPSIDASYEDSAFVSFPDILRVDALHFIRTGMPDLSAGPLVRFRFGRNQSDDPGQLRGLDNLPDTVELGGFVAYNLTPAVSVRANVGQSIDDKEGLVADVGISYARQFGPLTLIGTPSVGLIDTNYARTYYGINTGQASASGRPYYRPGGGVERTGIAFAATLPVTDKVALVATGSYGRLVGQAADSPIVRQGGSANQFVAALFVTYALY
jgi:outer membrane scaffolding protein for murein synthesis (MipA/OmpV family)